MLEYIKGIGIEDFILLYNGEIVKFFLEWELVLDIVFSSRRL